MANKKEDDVVTSAQASKVGSLLTDLLNDVKQSVAQEQKQIETESDRRAREEREARDREEGRKREEAQQKLIEEARRRNEALAKRERGENERKALATAPNMRPMTEVPAGPKSAEVAVAAPPAKTTSKLMLAALVIIGIGLGFGTSLALTPAPVDSPLDVNGAAKAVIAATRKQAAAEGRLQSQLDEAKKQIADLQKEVGAGAGEHKSLASQMSALQEELKAAKAELETLKADKGPRRTNGGGTPGSGVPNINGSIFNNK